MSFLISCISRDLPRLSFLLADLRPSFLSPIPVYSASLTADYLEVLVSHPEEGNQLDNHDYLTNIQRFEIMAMEVVSMTLMWASRIIDAHVSTLRVDMDPVFVRLMDLVESSSWQELKDDLRRMEGGEVLKQQEVEVGTSRLHARAAEIPRLNLKLIGELFFSSVLCLLRSDALGFIFAVLLRRYVPSRVSVVGRGCRAGSSRFPIRNRVGTVAEP